MENNANGNIPCGTGRGHTALMLFWNNCATNDPCHLCGARTGPLVAWEVMTRECSLVCDDCVREHAPELLAAKEAANKIVTAAYGNESPA
jgi:hypothetical protein